MPRIISPKRSIPTVAALLLATAVLGTFTAGGQDNRGPADAKTTVEQKTFRSSMQPLLKKYCIRCHNAEEMKSGIRLDLLDGTLEDRQLFLWKDILKQLNEEAMPPSDELQPTAGQRQALTSGIRQIMNAARARDNQKNGSTRRLTVSQYRNTIKDLLQLEDHKSYPW